MKLLFFLFALLFATAAPAQKRYQDLWKQVKELQEKDLPASAADKCLAIFRLAEQHGDFPVQLRAFMTRAAEREKIHPDSLLPDMDFLYGWMERTGDTVQHAVLCEAALHFLSAYIDSYRSEILQRSGTSGESACDPDGNMQGSPGKAAALPPISTLLPKWSARDFRAEGLRLMGQALRHPARLSLVSTEAYAPLVTRQDGSRYFAHDLLHLVGLHHIDLLLQLHNKGFLDEEACGEETARIFSLLSSFYEERGNRSALFLIGLKRAEMLHEAYQLPDSTYETSLRTLYTGNADMDVATEAALALARFLRGKQRNVEALALCEEAERRFLHYDRIKALRQLCTEIKRAEVEVQLDHIASPGQTMEVRVSHRNARSFQLKFYPLDLTTPDWRNTSVGGGKFMEQYASKPIVQEYRLTPSADYNKRDTVIRVTAPQEGCYVVRAVAETATETDGLDLLYVTQLMPFCMEDPAGGIHLYVVDRQSGAPLPNVSISVFEQNSKSPAIATLATDSNGHAFYPQTGRSIGFYAHRPGDTACPMLPFGSPTRAKGDAGEPRTSVELFTDRAIYRPGQTVYVKGIVWRTTGDSTRVCPGEEYEVRLQDANNQQIASARLRTNEYGSFDHAFTLPVRCLGGRFSVQCDRGWVGFQVEEYKRPSFEILLDTLSEAPRFGDTVRLTGRALTLGGFPLQGDSVRYSIRRNRFMPASWEYKDYRTGYSGIGKTFDGLTSTDSDGRFCIEIPTPLPQGISRKDYFAYGYQVNITVTDAAGESQEKVKTLRVGTKSLSLSFDTGQYGHSGRVELCKDSLSNLVFRAEDLDGVPRNVDIRARLTLPGKDAALWEETCKANQKSPAGFWAKLGSGIYDLRMEAVDSHGDTVRLTQPILLYGLHDTKVPCDTVFWTGSVPRSINRGNGDTYPSATDILVGSSEKDAHLFYSLYSDNKIWEQGFTTFSDSLLRIPLEYKPEYGNGAILELYLVKGGKQYSGKYRVVKPLPDKALKLKWSSFRDHLRAGQAEEWTLSISRPDGTPAEAELMASLYDAALDQIGGHRIGLTPYYPRYLRSARSQTLRHGTVHLYSYEATKPYRYPGFAYDQWDFPNFVFRSIMQVRLLDNPRSSASPQLAKSVSIGDVAGNSMAGAEQAVASAEEKSLVYMNTASTSEADGGDFSSSGLDGLSGNLRGDFRESAFFYPTLHTDSAGVVRISFTLPGSLTRWRLMGLAHTKDLCTGMLNESVTASKPFMLSAHLPRYLRQGDQAEVSARLLNASGTEVKGTLDFELFDPATMRVFHNEKREFRLAADSSAAYSFGIAAAEDWQVVGIRLMADADGFSDGEQHQLAVLSPRTHLVQAVPLTLRGEGEKEFDLSELFNNGSSTATQKKYTVELYANPVWTAVMALPVLNTPQNGSALDLAAAYYANTISAWLVGQSQELQQILLHQNGKSTGTSGKLMQDSELKALQLEETPWVAEAQEERTAQESIARLADRNHIEFQRKEMLSRLEALQNADGSFSWFPGMGGNSRVTAQVAEIMGCLYLLTNAAPKGEAKKLLEKAYNYLYEEEGKRFERLTGEAKQGYSLSATDVDYLYLCTFAPVQPEGSAAQAKAFYLGLLPKAVASLDPGQKARAVAILHADGQGQAARDCYRSIQEYATDTEELGSFFAGWYSRGYLPEQLLATIAEAARLMGDTALETGMQLNLLRHKQTQAWSNALANANAVYALLKGAHGLSGIGATCSLSLGRHMLSTTAQAGSAEALMGYAKATFPAGEGTSGKAIFRKTGPGMAWGAVYGECDELTDRIDEQGTRLAIEKELFVRRTSGGETRWEKIGPQTVLHKGDRVMTRLFVRNDRDMDFVYIKDTRAACFEPASQVPGYRAGAYRVEKDASTQLFIDRLARGTHTFETQSIVAHDGTYTSGIARLQCAYSAEFTGHSSAIELHVE